jgi:hypothetical protein
MADFEGYLIDERRGKMYAIFPPVPPACLSPAKIAKLGAAWDAADDVLANVWRTDCGLYSFSPDSVPFADYEAIEKRCHDAELAYGRAVRDRDMAELVKLQQRKAVPNNRDHDRCSMRRYNARKAQERFEKIGPEFYTRREIIDINNEVVQAVSLEQIAQEKFSMNARRQREDARKGINRT